mgnify:CR=1 FL=1
MRKLKLQIQISVDGFIAGPNGEMDWLTANWTEDIINYVNELTQSMDTILLGKNLATGFIPYWSEVSKDENNPENEAGKIFSSTPKIVFSKTVSNTEWENTTIENGDFIKKVQALKQKDGKDIIVYGGGKFVSSLIKEQLIDELHLFINPVILGKGMPIFQNIKSIQNLNLISSNSFDCGVNVLVYGI